MNMLCYAKPCSPLIECIRVAISIVGSDFARDDSLGDRGIPFAIGKEPDVSEVGRKRSVQDHYFIQSKRRKTSEFGANKQAGAGILDGQQDKQFACIFYSQINSFINLLKPDTEASSLRPEIAIVALSQLCIAFHGFPDTSLSIAIFQQVLSWIPWICNQVFDKVY